MGAFSLCVSSAYIYQHTVDCLINNDGFVCFIYYVIQIRNVITENILFENSKISVFAKCEGMIKNTRMGKLKYTKEKNTCALKIMAKSAENIL